MVALGDIFRISGLTSDQGRKLNGCYGKVTTSMNQAGRFGVTPFSQGDLRSFPFDESNAVRLKPQNITTLSRADKSASHMSLFRSSLTKFFPIKRIYYEQGRFMLGTGTPEKERLLRELYNA